MLSGYDLSQLCMREVGLTDPPEVSGQVSCLTCRQRERGVNRADAYVQVYSHTKFSKGQNVVYFGCEGTTVLWIYLL